MNSNGLNNVFVDIQKSVDTSQSTSSTTEDISKVCEVATGTLINLESPETASASEPCGEDQPDSIEAGAEGQTTTMQQSALSCV